MGDALALQKSGDWDDAGPQKAEEFGAESGGTAAKSSQDDEYRWAGVEDPKVMLTTSRDPSARLKKIRQRISFVNSQCSTVESWKLRIQTIINSLPSKWCYRFHCF